MDQQYASDERLLSSSYSSTAMWTSSPKTNPSCRKQSQRISRLSRRTFNAFSWDEDTSTANNSLSSQDGIFGSVDRDSDVDSRAIGDIVTSIDGSCTPAGQDEPFEEETIYYGSHGLVGDSASFMEQRWDIAGYSPDDLQPSLRATRPESESSVWESVTSDLHGQEDRDMETSESGGFDGDGGTLNDTDDGKPLLNPPRFEFVWVRPTPCHLGGCRPGHLFRTSQSWLSHVKNVHEKTLFCSKPGCTHTKPFANNTDLKRHNETKHDPTKPFKCMRSSCTRKVKAWSRKDKLKLHNRKYHSNWRCFFCSQSPQHEEWFDTEAELWLHTTMSCHAND